MDFNDLAIRWLEGFEPTKPPNPSLRQRVSEHTSHPFSSKQALFVVAHQSHPERVNVDRDLPGLDQSLDEVVTVRCPLVS